MKAPRNGGAEVYGDMKKDPTGQGPDPQRLSQVPVWIATHVDGGSIVIVGRSG
jgi:hypothetical protein